MLNITWRTLTKCNPECIGITVTFSRAVLSFNIEIDAKVVYN